MELGLGFNAVYARAKIERFAGDRGSWLPVRLCNLLLDKLSKGSIGSYRQRYRQ